MTVGRALRPRPPSPVGTRPTTRETDRTRGPDSPHPYTPRRKAPANPAPHRTKQPSTPRSPRRPLVAVHPRETCRRRKASDPLTAESGHAGETESSPRTRPRETTGTRPAEWLLPVLWSRLPSDAEDRLDRPAGEDSFGRDPSGVNDQAWTSPDQNGPERTAGTDDVAATDGGGGRATAARADPESAATRTPTTPGISTARALPGRCRLRRLTHRWRCQGGQSRKRPPDGTLPGLAV